MEKNPKPKQHEPPTKKKPEPGKKKTEPTKKKPEPGKKKPEPTKKKPKQKQHDPPTKNKIIIQIEKTSQKDENLYSNKLKYLLSKIKNQNDYTDTGIRFALKN